MTAATLSTVILPTTLIQFHSVTLFRCSSPHISFLPSHPSQSELGWHRGGSRRGGTRGARVVEDEILGVGETSSCFSLWWSFNAAPAASHRRLASASAIAGTCGGGEAEHECGARVLEDKFLGMGEHLLVVELQRCSGSLAQELGVNVGHCGDVRGRCSWKCHR